MWTTTNATLDIDDPDAGRERPSRLHTRLARLSRLLLHLGRIWLAAVVVADWVERERHFALRRGSASRMLSILGVEIEVRGEVPAYDEPILLVSNHISWLDPYALNCANGARFVAKAEVADWPVVGTSAKRFGAFFLVRGSCRSAARVKDQLTRALRSRDPVGVFPESTTTDGSTLLRFYPAMFQAAIDARAMVQPVAIRYRSVGGRRTAAAAFIGDMSIADSLRRILPMQKIIVELTFCAPLYSRGRHRRELAARAHQMIAEALQLPCDEPARPIHLYPLSRKAA